MTTSGERTGDGDRVPDADGGGRMRGGLAAEEGDAVGVGNFGERCRRCGDGNGCRTSGGGAWRWGVSAKRRLERKRRVEWRMEILRDR